MLDRLGARAPFVIMAVLGVFMAAQYYLPHPMVQEPRARILQWKQLADAFTIYIALFGLLLLHLRRVERREARWGYSLVTLTSMIGMAAVGIFAGVGDDTLFARLFAHLMSPIEATMFSLLAFFIASAAFRAFRARSLGAGVLLGSALIVLLGLTPGMDDWCPPLAELCQWVLNYPNTAAKRAILLGVAAGGLTVALKTILGIDRTILGRDR